MSQQPVDVDYVVAKAKGNWVSNVSLWIFLGLGVAVIIGLSKLWHVLGLLGFGAYFLWTAWTGLTVTIGWLFRIADLLGLTGNDAETIAKYRSVALIQTAEFCGMALLTYFLYLQLF